MREVDHLRLRGRVAVDGVVQGHIPVNYPQSGREVGFTIFRNKANHPREGADELAAGSVDDEVTQG
jgi:hypothetical protein